MNVLVRFSDGLSRLFGAASMLLLASSVVVVSQMVFVRYLLGHSTVWQTEFVVYAVIASTFLGAPYVLLLKGHVGVDLVPNALPPRHARLLKLFASIVGFAFCALVTYSGGHFWYEAFSKGWRTDTVWAISLWIPLLPLPVGMGMVCVQYLAEMMKPFERATVEGFGA